MKLFIFEPSKDWDYCGGAIIITANSFEEVKTKFQNEDRRFYKEEDEIEHKIVKGIDSWILTHTFDVDYGESGILVENFNYA